MQGQNGNGFGHTAGNGASERGEIAFRGHGGRRPRVLAYGGNSERHLIQDDRYLYWSDAEDGTVTRLSKSGGVPVVLAIGQVYPGALTLAGGWLYWVTRRMDMGTVVRMPVGGGEIELIESGQNRPQSIAVSGTTVVWTNFGDGLATGTVMRKDLGGRLITLASEAEAAGLDRHRRRADLLDGVRRQTALVFPRRRHDANPSLGRAEALRGGQRAIDGALGAPRRGLALLDHGRRAGARPAARRDQAAAQGGWADPEPRVLGPLHRRHRPRPDARLLAPAVRRRPLSRAQRGRRARADHGRKRRPDAPGGRPRRRRSLRVLDGAPERPGRRCGVHDGHDRAGLAVCLLCGRIMPRANAARPSDRGARRTGRSPAVGS